MEQATETRPAAKHTRTKAPADAREAAPVTPLHGDRAKPAEQVRNAWAVNVSADYTIDDLADARFWVHAGRRFKLGDSVECRHPKWIALGFVTDIVNDCPRVTILASAATPERIGEAGGTLIPEGFDIRLAKPGESEWLDHWLIIRLSDGYVFNKNTQHRSFDAARAHLLSSAIFRDR